jgi:hypothetical protein
LHRIWALTFTVEDDAMRILGPAIALTFAIGLSCAPTQSTFAAPRSGAAAIGTREATKALKEAHDTVETEAVQALTRMSTYLGTLTSFEIKTDTTLDLVTTDGQRVQVGGNTQYKVHRPDGFQIDVVSDVMSRRYFFDGKQFTVYAPKLDYYATAAAPPTIKEALDVIYNKFGIALPLEDLFRWSDPDSPRAQKLKSGFLVGPATVDGVATDHYAFREGDHDWEIWIQQGEKPIPRKLAIVDRSDSARPTYVARLTWNMSPTLVANDFTFKPGKDAKQIHLATADQ